MSFPTDEQNAAAREFLNEWVPDASTGQWAALAEFLAKRDEAKDKERDLA